MVFLYGLLFVGGVSRWKDSDLTNSITLVCDDHTYLTVISILERGRCRACTEEVKSSDMLSHMKAHLVKKYACEFCGKKGRKHYLKAHIRVHTGERPYKVCFRYFMVNRSVYLVD